MSSYPIPSSRLVESSAAVAHTQFLCVFVCCGGLPPVKQFRHHPGLKLRLVVDMCWGILTPAHACREAGFFVWVVVMTSYVWVLWCVCGGGGLLVCCAVRSRIQSRRAPAEICPAIVASVVWTARGIMDYGYVRKVGGK